MVLYVAQYCVCVCIHITNILSFLSDWFKPKTLPTDVDRQVANGEEQIEMVEKGKRILTSCYLDFNLR